MCFGVQCKSCSVQTTVVQIKCNFMLSDMYGEWSEARTQNVCMSVFVDRKLLSEPFGLYFLYADDTLKSIKITTILRIVADAIDCGSDGPAADMYDIVVVCNIQYYTIHSYSIQNCGAIT